MSEEMRVAVAQYLLNLEHLGHTKSQAYESLGRDISYLSNGIRDHHVSDCGMVHLSRFFK